MAAISPSTVSGPRSLPAPRILGRVRARLLTALHRWFGIVRLPPLRRAFVFRHADVLQVLGGGGGAVSVREYGRRMEETTGPFLLGRDPGGAYRKEREALGRALRLREEDVADRIRTLALLEADAVVKRAVRESTGDRARLDVVTDLARKVPVRLVETYLGVPDPHDALVGWNEKFAIYIFGHDLPIGRRRRRRSAREAGAAFREHVRGEVDRRRRLSGGPNPDDTVLGRLLEDARHSSLTDEDVTQILVGTVAGGLVAVIGLFCGAVDMLLELPSGHLADLRHAALAPVGSEADERVLGYLREAARFAVYPPFLYRELTGEVVVAPGTERETAVPRGHRVWTAPKLAAFDPYVYPEPDRFDPERPEESYLFFGAGTHRCVAQRMGEIVMHSMARPLFGRAGLRREGPLRKEGAYPRFLPVSFSVSDAASSTVGPGDASSARPGVRSRASCPAEGGRGR